MKLNKTYYGLFYGDELMSTYDTYYLFDSLEEAEDNLKEIPKSVHLIEIEPYSKEEWSQAVVKPVKLVEYKHES